jgi:plasmid maintenance system antidote protein VapI
MSVEDFANLIEKTPSDVKNILNGEESINLDRAMKICAVF